MHKMKIIERWNVIKKFVKKEYSVSDVSYQFFIEPLKIVEIDDGVIYLFLATKQNHQYIEKFLARKYGELFQNVFEKKFGCTCSVSFIVSKDENEAMKKIAVMKKLKRETTLELVKTPEEYYNSFFLHGTPEMGQKHILCTIGNADHTRFSTKETVCEDVFDYIEEGDDTI